MLRLNPTLPQLCSLICEHYTRPRLHKMTVHNCSISSSNYPLLFTPSMQCNPPLSLFSWPVPLLLLSPQDIPNVRQCTVSMRATPRAKCSSPRPTISLNKLTKKFWNAASTLMVQCQQITPSRPPSSSSFHPTAWWRFGLQPRMRRAH